MKSSAMNIHFFSFFLLFSSITWAMPVENEVDAPFTSDAKFVNTNEHFYTEARKQISQGQYQSAFERSLPLCENYGPCQALKGLMYENGYYVEKNVTRAIQWYETADRNGVLEAKYNIGTLYLGLKEYCKAHDVFSSIEEKRAETYYNLGLMYLYGWCVDQHLAKAKEYMLLAKAKGFGPALKVLDYINSVQDK